MMADVNQSEVKTRYMEGRQEVLQRTGKFNAVLLELDHFNNAETSQHTPLEPLPQHISCQKKIAVNSCHHENEPWVVTSVKALR